MSPGLRAIALTTLLTGFAAPAAAAPAMFQASFIFHAWGNDASGGTATPYISNDWTAVPLGYDCQHEEQYTANGALATRWCSPAKMARGHPATGTWSRSIGPGMPPRITVPQSAIGVELYTYPLTGTDTYTPHCCRGFLNAFTSYTESFTYATFVNAAGSFFAGGGAAAANGYNNKTGTGTKAGTWRIRAGVNGFGGAMGLLGKYGVTGHFSLWPNFYYGVSSWAMVPPLGRTLSNTPIGTTGGGATIFQNPFTKTDMWYAWSGSTTTLTAIGSGTLWTTGTVTLYARAGAFTTILHRAGYDNRNASGTGNIQLVTPGLTHWSGRVAPDHTGHIGILTIHVPEPGVTLLFAAGAGALVWLRYMSRRR